MKTRLGFVSNSSVSSFVILGCKMNLTEEQIEILNKCKDLHYQYSYDDNDLPIVGIEIVDISSDESYIEGSIEVNIFDLIEKLKENFKLINLTFPEKEIKIFAGTREG